jgi:conjugative relaxase-like TrwC/TraI family protein
VFSAPKSVSLQALVGGDARLIQAQIRAVQRSVAEVETYALARTRGGRDDVVSGNVLAAAFNHLAARSADNVRLPDPQLHTHVVLLNMTRRPDSAWRALNPVEIYGAQQFGSAVYRAELAREVQRLGYRIQVTAGNGAWELEDYNREQVMAFSQRRQDIEQRMAAQGLSGPKAAQIVALNSRGAKRDYDEQELKADWRSRAETAGIDTNRHLWQALGRGDLNVSNARDAYAALDFAKAHTTSREAVIDRRALETAALQHGMGRLDLTTVRNQMATDEQGHSLIRVREADPHHPQGAFTTDEMLALERENLALVRAGKGVATPIAEAEDIRQWGESRGLLPDQLRAAELTLIATDWITAIEGLAGATKTTTVGAIRELAEGQGVTVRGFGPTSGSVKALREAGVEARTMASLLANPLLPPKARELWIVDESSLLATRPANQMLKGARAQGVARLVFVGDQRQHHAIEAGAPVRQLLRTELRVAELTNIRRQRDPELKRAVELAAHGRTSNVIDRLEQQGRIIAIRESARRYAAIATDYLRGHQAGQRTLVVSPGNDERHALNEHIRSLLVAHSQVAREGQSHAILVRRDLTRPQLQNARNYQEGDVLHFSRGSKRLDLAKDAYVAIERVDTQRNILTLRASDHRKIELSPRRWRGLEAYRWEQRTLAVGDRLQFRAPDRMLDVANGEFATVLGLDPQRATLRLDSKREISANLAQLRRIDHGYASTSHAAQGATVDRVIVNIDATRSAQLVNRKQFYVSLSRARYDARFYTDDAQALRRAVTRNPEKTIALDVVHSRPTEQLNPDRATNELNLTINPPSLQPRTTVRITR